MKQQFRIFMLRWVLNSFGLWIAVRLLGNNYNQSHMVETVLLFLLAGFVFSVINSFIRPLLIIISLPIILLTLGLFTLVVNGFMVYITLGLMPDQLSVGFLNSILAGIILSLLNYIVSTTLEIRRDKSEKVEE